MAVLEIDRPEQQGTGAIRPGNEEAHRPPPQERERLLSFEAACEILFSPYIDKETRATVCPNVVEVNTFGEKYVIAKDVDAQGNPTISVLMHQGLRNHAVSIIDTPNGELVEQHEFRIAYGLIRESESYPLGPDQYEIFDRVTDSVIQPTSRIVVLL